VNSSTRSQWIQNKNSFRVISWPFQDFQPQALRRSIEKEPEDRVSVDYNCGLDR
jgi:hypothetical protein